MRSANDYEVGDQVIVHFRPTPLHGTIAWCGLCNIEYCVRCEDGFYRICTRSILSPPLSVVIGNKADVND